jgi:hypothetical protein
MRVSLCEVYFFLGNKGIQVEEPIVYLKLLDIDPNTISEEVMRVLSNIHVLHESDSSDNIDSTSRKLMETRIKSLFLKQIDPNSSRRLCRPLFRNPTYSRRTFARYKGSAGFEQTRSSHFKRRPMYSPPICENQREDRGEGWNDLGFRYLLPDPVNLMVQSTGQRASSNQVKQR